ncbi:hypothetical protein PVAND_007077 [Polypedilum vanderplanki]|uniref:EGF-like domain-containing protein n=1 Tax=Polypedilum vanderplanki TaxID=319348 RepID=A0A9J6C547_POLVA|nr:hypothetical protein PVAND_007077 [Polypedilum vanderplanki]
MKFKNISRFKLFMTLIIILSCVISCSFASKKYNIKTFDKLTRKSDESLSLDSLSSVSSAAATCSEFQFQCKSNAVCIPLQMRCDLSNDCEDGSDENSTECKRIPVIQSECDNENFFHCKLSKKCIPNEWLCDGENDCGLIGKFDLLDPSDENVNCIKKCPVNQVSCSNGICLHISKFCDGHSDCQDDELFCGNKASCKNLKCEYACKSTPHGPKCFCPPNQDIVNETKCVAQKACKEDENDGEICDQLCSIVKNRNKCICAPGYERSNQKCYGINSPITEPTLLFVLTPQEIYKIILPSDRNNSENTSPVTLTQVLKLKNLITMEVNFSNHTVCVLEDYEIFCYNVSNFMDKWKMPNPDFLPLESASSSNILISQFALDWVSQNWYFMDTINNFIFLCSHEMKNCRIIIQTSQNDPIKVRAFVIDPTSGFLFLAKYDTNNRTSASIVRYFLDGTNDISLLKGKIFYPHDLTLDVAVKKIYFLDHYFDFIQQCDYDGSNRKFLQKLPFMKFHRINFFENMFFGAVNENTSVVQISKSSAIFIKTLAENLKANTKVLKIFHQQTQPTTKTKVCVKDNNCEHLCVPTIEENNNGVSKLLEKCICKEGFKLKNGKCILRDSKSFIMFVQEYAKSRTLKAIVTDGSKEEVFTPITGLKSNIAFDVDLNNKLIYFTTYTESNIIRNNTIECRSFNGSYKTIIKGNFGNIQSMAYDWIGNNLYYSSSLPKYKISVLKLKGNVDDGPAVKTLINKDFIGPSSIALDVENGKMYWTSFAENYNIGGKIETAWMDGTSRSTLVSKENDSSKLIYWPVSLTFDKEKNTLYWLDALSQTIDSYNLDGKRDHKQKKLGNSYAQSLTVLSNTIYWTDNIKNSIESLNDNKKDNDSKIFYRSPYKKSFLKSVDINRYLDHVEKEIQVTCPGIWLNTPIDGVCVCPDGFSKNALGTACIQSPIVNPTTPRDIIKCQKFQFTCKSGEECIDHKYVCDGSQDCSDGSDEKEAPDGPCPKKCDFKCDGNKCIDQHQVCDGNNDCLDESDETVKICHNKTSSDEYAEGFYDYCDEFLCENSNCVLLEQKCDGVNNCGDNSDEKDCSVIPTIASSTASHTEYKDIVEESDTEDGFEDVDYNVNLTECKPPNYYCEKDRRCIPVHNLCDGINQCSDNSDESGRCNERLCDHFSECQFFCHNAPHRNGFVCSCPQHMVLESNGRNCSEPQMCDEFSTCSHSCIQLNPSKIKCKCFHGYQLSDDNFTCISEHEHRPILLISNRHVLRGISLKSPKEIKSYYSMSKNLIGTDFYYDRHSKSYEIVWSDITKDKIYLGKLRGDELHSIRAIVESDLSTTEAVAIDWIGKNLYWIDASLKQIEVATKDGLHRTTLISENISKPRSIGLDSRFGFLFWSDWEDDEPRIERATLAGENRKAIFNLKQIGGAWPNGISLDYAKKRIFFLDAKSKEIHTIDYDGNNHKRILRNPEYLHHPFAITIYENNLYWTDWRLSSVITANKFTGSNVTIFYQASIQPFDVKIMHPSRQPWDYNGEGTAKEIISPCENSPCSHLCLLNTNNSYKCACPHLMRISDNNAALCEKVKDIMFYITNKSEIRAIELKHPYSSAISTIYHTSQIIMPNHIAIHPKEKRIFWSDVQLREIKSVKLSTSITPSDQKIETILDAEIDNVHGFTVDWISELLFFSQAIPEDEDKDINTSSSNNGGHRLLVSNLKGEYLSKVLDNVNDIYSLIVAPELRKIFYTIMNNVTAKYRYEIRQCNMDGTNDTWIIGEDEYINSLVYEHKLNRLYFVKNYRKIFFLELKTNYTQLVNTFYGAKKSANSEIYANFFITSLELFDDKIFFGENSTATIRTCNKTTCPVPDIYRNNTSNIKQLKLMTLYDISEDLLDINGCSTQQQGNERKCDHLCIPKGQTNYVCKCAIGYMTDERDSSKCVSEDNFLMYSLDYELKGLTLKIPSKHIPLTPLQKLSVISAFDFDARNDFIYFSDHDKGEIIRIKKDGSSRQTIMSSWDFDQLNSDWLGGIAVEWMSQNIFWTDQKRGLIEVARLDGSYRKVIAWQLFKPTGIRVDPYLGLLFYSTGDNKIYSHNLDGTNKQLVTKKSDIAFSDFVIDIPNQTIYLCETKRNKIWKLDYDGNGKIELNIKNVQNPIALDIADKKLYWAERGTGKIKRVSLDENLEVEVLKSNLPNQIKSLRIFSTKKQFEGSNQCSMPDYGSCSELCLYNGTKANCFCSHGYLNDLDQRSCRRYDNDLFFSKKDGIQRISVDNENNALFSIKNENHLQHVVALSFDDKRGQIFYSDAKLNAICMTNYDGTKFEQLIKDQNVVEGIAFNPQDNHLFWTVNSEAEIRSIDLKLFMNGTIENKDINKSVIKILKLKKGIDKLRAVVVEPCLNMVYYSNWNSKAPSISRVYVTGYGNEDIITKDILIPNALTLDLNDKKIFWADARLDKIERCDYDGKNCIILSQTAPKHPFSIAVFEEFIFWSDWTLHSILRANKYSGNDVIYLKKDIEHPMGLFVAQDQIKNCTNGLCAILNGGCEDICLPHGDSIKCECSQGYLAKDGKRCLQRDKVSSCNSTIEFECKTGECIPLLITCDGISHCIDNSDEAINYCATRKCPEEVFFQCRNFKCIYKNETCDHIDQCSDGSDEENCACKEDEFRCGGGECINIKYKCDFDPDCKDASDEMGCEPRDCSETDNKFKEIQRNTNEERSLVPCPNTTACYMVDWTCDGENDCWDWSDEKDCEEKRANKTCSDDQFECSNGRCINIDWVCDGEDDCHDSSNDNPSSDEKDCQYHCSMGQFSCDNSTVCIPLTWMCDGVLDCKDGTDEKKCTNGTTSNEPVTCAPYQAICQNGECISKSEMCDGHFDCSDLSDESEVCIFPPYSEVEVEIKMCNESEFTCANKECISHNALCDLNIDCSDGSDENTTVCENYPLYCKNNSNKFLCLSGSCISMNLTCDGQNDCGDYSDERSCNINECLYVDCEHNCTDLKIGYECSCNRGFKKSELDSHKCNDINECEDRPCSQLCLNTYGSYHCECLEGYIKTGNSCKIDSAEHPKIILANRFYIRSVTLDGHAELLLHNLSNAVAIDYDWSKNYIYFSDVTATRSEIIRVKWNENETSNREVLHQQNLKNPDGIAFDWIGKNLYWCDKGRQTIEVSKDSGRYRKILIDDKLDEPRAIALDPYRKYLYWTDWGKNPHIGRAGMDGSDAKFIVTENLGWPNALTISFETNELFFGDAREDFISVCNLDGSNRKVVAHRKYNPSLNLHHIFSIAVWENQIYFSDWESKSIEYCDKYTGKNCGTLIKLIHRPMDLRIFHPIKQRRLKTSSSYENLMKRKSDIKGKDNKKKFDVGNVKDNPCATANCSALCLLSPIYPYYKCACPDNFYLDDDLKTCIDNCTSAQFYCKKSMKCIPFFWKCDNQPDCEFNEDELDNCTPFYCEAGQFQCDVKDKSTTSGTGKQLANCLDPSKICDGQKQCEDETDEENCEKYGCFIESYFQCEKTENTSAYCVPKNRVCNGVIDCPSGNDEKSCPSKVCSSSQFKCESNDVCIPKVWQCDGDADCLDHSDEKNCTERKCFETEFRCSTGRCIPSTWVCDADSDCPNGEDEGEKAHCDAVPVSNSCDATYFRCNNSGTCIPGRWKCDGAVDCDDGSDELDCQQRACSESEFKCKDGRCIPGSLRCNKEYNCHDFSDEENCTVSCDDSVMFKCANKNQCVDKSFVCDGEPDCEDYSDEKNCDCQGNDFKCSGEFEKCISNDWLCDGIHDCPDKSDEHDSRCLSRYCAGHAIKCTNGKCIPKYYFCDGIDHCGDNSDEINCNSTKQIDSSYINVGCKFGICSQLCNEKGSKGTVQCKCATGYHKYGSMRNGTCKAIEGQHLIFTSSESELRFIYELNYGVIESNSKNSQRKIVMPVHSFIKTNSSKITSFDFVTDEEHNIILFWLDSMPTNNLRSLKISTKHDFDEIKNKGFDGTNATILTTNKMKNTLLKAISIDWITMKIYIIENDMIKTTDFDGNLKKTVVDARGAQDLVIDPQSRRMFWSTINRKIFVSSMDGSHKQRLVTENIELASGLAIDYPSRRIYWCDTRKSTIETVNLEGQDRQIVRKFEGVNPLTSLQVSPAKLDIFEDDLYVTMTNQTIFKINKFGWQKEYEEISSGPYKFKASHIRIVHTFKSKNSLPNPCRLYPCDESAICFLSSTDQTGRTCNCPDSLYIQKNGTHVSCRDKSEIPSLCYKPCTNGGKCRYSGDEMICDCPPQFEGEYCEHYICSEFCKNHGVCSLPSKTMTLSRAELKLKRTCSCTSEWKGARCEIPASICKENMCRNGGQCNVQSNPNGTYTHSCTCLSNFSGQYCENCSAIKCMNGGTCYRDESNKKYHCLCPERFTGIFCEVDRCKNYCKNNGRCYIEAVKGPKCDCENNFSGERCEIDDLPCKECPERLPDCDMVCQNNGMCRKDINGIESCMCVGQWSGKHCELPPKCVDDECGKCNETSSINECLCRNGLVQACVIFNENSQNHPEVVASEMFNDEHETLSIIVILSLTFLLMSTLAILAVFYVRKWQRRVRFFAHARLNENVEEITNPIFDFSATDRDDINLPVTSISNSDDKGHFSNPIYESMYSSSHRQGLLERKSDDDEEESKNELL